MFQSLLLGSFIGHERLLTFEFRSLGRFQQITFIFDSSALVPRANISIITTIRKKVMRDTTLLRTQRNRRIPYPQSHLHGMAAEDVDWIRCDHSPRA